MRELSVLVTSEILSSTRQLQLHRSDTELVLAPKEGETLLLSAPKDLFVVQSV